MSVRSFHSVFMATAVAGAALGCYLVSLRVASERAALEAVEHQIVQTQRDIRLLQTEIGTRARLAQLERWNVRVLALSAPTADQILGDKFQLARLVKPEEKSIDAPIVLAAAPALAPQQPFDADPAEEPSAAPQALLHEASVKLPARNALPAKPMAKEIAQAGPIRRAKAAAAKAVPSKSGPVTAAAGAEVRLASSQATKPASAKGWMATEKSGEKKAKLPLSEVTPPLRTAKVDPLAPLAAEPSKTKALRTQR